MRLFFLLISLTVLVACDSKQHGAVVFPAVAIYSGDECHLCGMLIQNFPGPKGEAYVRSQAQALKFCSTRDLFAYLMQPDTQTIVREIYVHDMGTTDWQRPDYSAHAFIDARKAFYVVKHPLTGAMGHTLAPFAERSAAEAFVKANGGRILDFKDINFDVLNHLQPEN